MIKLPKTKHTYLIRKIPYKLQQNEFFDMNLIEKIKLKNNKYFIDTINTIKNIFSKLKY